MPNVFIIVVGTSRYNGGMNIVDGVAVIVCGIWNSISTVWAMILLALKRHFYSCWLAVSWLHSTSTLFQSEREYYALLAYKCTLEIGLVKAKDTRRYIYVSIIRHIFHGIEKICIFPMPSFLSYAQHIYAVDKKCMISFLPRYIYSILSKLVLLIK